MCILTFRTETARTTSLSEMKLHIHLLSQERNFMYSLTPRIERSSTPLFKSESSRAHLLKSEMSRSTFL